MPGRAGRRVLLGLGLQRRRSFEENDRGAYSVDNLTATPNDDGSVTVDFGGCAGERPICIPVLDGWNHTVRLYRPRAEVLDSSWTFPSIAAA